METRKGCSVGKTLNVERLRGLFTTMSSELQNANPPTEEGQQAVRRQQARCRKRANLGDPNLKRVAIQKFLEVNARVRDLVVDLDPSIVYSARLFIAECFERFNARFDDTLIQCQYDPRHLERLWRFGPGASNGITGTHTAEKLDQPMTCTTRAAPLVANLRGRNTYLGSYDRANRCAIPIVKGSRMTTVPKNEETERTIAVEPSGNMALQLALGSYIQEVLASIGLDIRDQQPKNKALARRGSIDGSFATIDLSSASDMFSLPLIKMLLPAPMVLDMLALRSPCTTLPDGSEVELHMVSTMGNGFTFPMMTLIFVSLIYAVRLKQGGPRNWIDWSKTAVFGDDIIVPTHEALDLIHVLEGAGFVVNTDKSYLSGEFRESCGGDYWLGRDITPFYVRDLDCDAHVYVALNKVFEWCARENLLLWQTIGYLRSLVDGPFRFVPEWYGDDAGFRTSEVTGRFTYLKPVKISRPYKGNFEMMLAVGGYLRPDGPNLEYNPRPFKTRYMVGRARVPKGFLSGADPLTRSAPVTAYVQSYDFLLRLS